MKELFREQDFTRVAFFRGLLEADGIPTYIRNEFLSVTEAPIPVFFPALCVQHDEDYERAVQIIRQHLAKQNTGTQQELPCPACGEINPGNFETCWSCGAEIPSGHTPEV